jgi:hypothetical protein
MAIFQMTIFQNEMLKIWANIVTNTTTIYSTLETSTPGLVYEMKQ